MTNIKELQHKLKEITELYERVSSERIVYITLWCEVPVEQRLQIHASLLGKAKKFDKYKNICDVCECYKRGVDV